MRTTLDLPDELLKRAKAEAALRGITLRAFFTELLQGHRAATRQQAALRVELPLIRTRSRRRVNPTNAELEEALLAGENIRALR